MAEAEAAKPDPTEEMLALARDRRFEDLEAAWMQRLENADFAASEFFPVADYLVRKKLADQAALLLWSLISAVAERRGPEEAARVAERSVSIAPDSDTLREDLVQRYKLLNPSSEELPAIIEASGILAGAPPDKAIGMINKCLHFRPGTYVIHVRSRRVGKVLGFSEGRFRILSDGDEQVMPPERLLSDWESLPDDDFRALAAFETVRLKKLANDEPIRVIMLAVAACGGKAEFRQLKALLIPAIISLDNWSAWWNSVKVPLKRSSGVEMSSGTQPVIALRKEGDNFASRMLAEFDDEPDPYEKIRRCLEFIAEVDAGHDADQSIAPAMAERFIRLAETNADKVVSLALLGAAAALSSRFPAAQNPAAVLSQVAGAVPDMTTVVRSIPNDDAARCVLEALKPLRGDAWLELLAEIFPICSLRMCEWVARELQKAGRNDLLQSAMRQTVANPEGRIEALAWAWRRELSGEGVEGLPDPLALTAMVLDVTRRLSRVGRNDERRGESRQLAGKVRALLSANDFKLLRGVIENCDAPGAHRLHEAVKDNEGLTAEMRSDILGLIKERHPQEFDEFKPLWEDGHIYTTEAGFARRQAELHKLMNEDIPRNAIAIGKAASLGDLRENWEYKSALEERDRLVERTTRAKSDVDHAKVMLDPNMISGDEVNVGTEIVIRHVESGKERTIAFLGPWDSDIPRGIYSYLAPLSLSFMGKRVGDQVRATFDDAEGAFEIVAIRKII